MTTPSHSEPSYRRPEVVAATKDLQLIDDLIAGTRRIHTQAERYLFKWPDELPKVYEIRSQCASVFEGLGRTLSAGTGMLFAKAPSVTWNKSETKLAVHAENIDLAGAALHVFLKRFTELCLQHGLALILVDHPSRPEGTVTLADEARLNLRPKWSLYPRGSILSWRTTTIDNQAALDQLVLYEPTDEAVGEFGVETVERFRVLKLVNGEATWTLYRKKKQGAEGPEFTPDGAGIYRNRAAQPLRRLPVAVGYAGRMHAPLVVAPPLLGVAFANLEHWQIASDIRFYEMACAIPQPTVNGRIIGPDGNPTGNLPLGPLVPVVTEKDGKFSWTEMSGSSLEQLRESLRARLEDMGRMGVTFLAGDKRAAETAEAKRLDSTAENATLATAAQGIEDAANLALEIHAEYCGIAKADAPTIAISRDFTPTGPQAPLLTAFAALVKAGFPKRPIAEYLQGQGLVAADTDLDDFVADWDAGELGADDAARFDDAVTALPAAA